MYAGMAYSSMLGEHAVQRYARWAQRMGQKPNEPFEPFQMVDRPSSDCVRSTGSARF